MIGGKFTWVRNTEGYCNVCGKAWYGEERLGVFQVDDKGHDVWVCPMCLVRAVHQIVEADL